MMQSIFYASNLECTFLQAKQPLSTRNLSSFISKIQCLFCLHVSSTKPWSCAIQVGLFCTLRRKDLSERTLKFIIVAIFQVSDKKRWEPTIETVIPLLNHTPLEMVDFCRLLLVFFSDMPNVQWKSSSTADLLVKKGWHLYENVCLHWINSNSSSTIFYEHASTCQKYSSGSTKYQLNSSCFHTFA